MLVEVRFALRPGTAAPTRRSSGAPATGPVAAAGAAVWLDGDTIADAGLGLAAVGATRRTRTRAEAALRGKAPSEEAFAEAGRIAAEDCEPGLRPARARRTTSATWRPSSPSERCAAPSSARCADRRRAMQVTLTVNGDEVTREIEPRLLLVHFLRDELGLTGTHWGCDTSNCGTCVVLMDDEPVKSCTVLAAMAGGHEVRTVEGLEHDGALDPVQQGFIEEHGLQCGFCTPGMMMTARALLDRNPDPSDDGDPRGHLRPDLPLHGLPEHRQVDPLGRRHPLEPAGERRELSSWPRSRTSRPIGYGRHQAQGGPALHPRQGHLRRRRRAARDAARRRAAQPVRARAHRLDRRHRRPAAPEGARRHHRQGPRGPEARLDADAVGATCRPCWPPTRCASRARRSPSWWPTTATPPATRSS